MGVEIVQGPATLINELPPGILAAVFIPADDEGEVELVMPSECELSPILIPALVRAVTASAV